MKNFSQEMPTMKEEVNKFHCDAAVKRKLNKKAQLRNGKVGEERKKIMWQVRMIKGKRGQVTLFVEFSNYFKSLHVQDHGEGRLESH